MRMIAVAMIEKSVKREQGLARFIFESVKGCSIRLECRASRGHAHRLIGSRVLGDES